MRGRERGSFLRGVELSLFFVKNDFGCKRQFCQPTRLLVAAYYKFKLFVEYKMSLAMISTATCSSGK